MKLRPGNHRGVSAESLASGSEEILTKLRTAASGRIGDKVTGASPELYAGIHGPLTEAFRENAVKVNANVTLAGSEKELTSAIVALISENGWKELVCQETHLREIFLRNNFPFPVAGTLSDFCEVAITGCENLVAQLGSVIVSSAQSGSRKIFIYPPVHLVIAFSSQLVETLEEGYQNTIQRYAAALPSFITIITGPSRTADIEKTLVLGAHGPVQLHIFILNNGFSLK